MSLLIFVIFLLVVVGIVCAIAYYIPFPPPLAWLKWVIPVVALLIALVMIAQKMGIA
jgi:hypothetical protein